MKRSSLFLFSSLAVATALGFAACGSKDSTAHPVRPTLLAKVSGKAGNVDAQGNEIKDQAGAVSIAGTGVFSPVTEDGLMDMDVNLEADDTAVKKIQTLSKEAESDIKAASDLRTYINLGCVGADGKPGLPLEIQNSGALKDMAETKVTATKDVTIYSAYAVLMCGKVKLPSRLKMSAKMIYLLNAYPSAELKPGKWVISASSIYSRGTENTLTLPIKADGDTALDLSVATEIIGTQNRKGDVRKDGGKLQLHVAKKPAARHSKPNDTRRASDGTALDGQSIAPVQDLNSDLKNENAIEEDNGTNQNNI